MATTSELQNDLLNVQSIIKELPELAAIVLKFLLAPKTFDFQSALGEFAGKYESIEAPVLKSATRGVIVLYQAGDHQHDCLYFACKLLIYFVWHVRN